MRLLKYVIRITGKYLHCTYRAELQWCGVRKRETSLR